MELLAMAMVLLVPVAVIYGVYLLILPIIMHCKMNDIVKELRRLK